MLIEGVMAALVPSSTWTRLIWYGETSGSVNWSKVTVFEDMDGSGDQSAAAAAHVGSRRRQRGHIWTNDAFTPGPVHLLFYLTSVFTLLQSRLGCSEQPLSVYFVHAAYCCAWSMMSIKWHQTTAQSGFTVRPYLHTFSPNNQSDLATTE